MQKLLNIQNKKNDKNKLKASTEQVIYNYY